MVKSLGIQEAICQYSLYLKCTAGKVIYVSSEKVCNTLKNG